MTAQTIIFASTEIEDLWIVRDSDPRRDYPFMSLLAARLAVKQTTPANRPAHFMGSASKIAVYGSPYGPDGEYNSTVEVVPSEEG